ncbi:hypothetical protein GCM10012275_53980 [Longimycelium tulufanense]|uniref:Uncharacterized protein n=1 Tax=Longimycelium tulufanense TaxID=907463 RepID=A0A8J3FZ09_9PSEU|nr:hypothetical protein [Longimycelium tulufanense]GGM76412.1 hypothetical protein GCM10012275_53980 [Longimycelium tulufanense]
MARSAARPTPTPATTRRRTLVALATLGVLVLVVAAGVLYRLTSASAPTPGLAPEGDWDVAAQHALAAAPMPVLPGAAAQPQPLATAGAGEPIVLPAASGSPVEGWIPAEFPATPQGALAQVVALWEAALVGADPAVLERAYRALSLPGAPDPAAAVPHRAVVALRAGAGLPATGTVSDLHVDFAITHGLVKGSTDEGRYAVVCVLGELSVSYHAHAARGGLGDCQALRFSGSGWRISPTPLPAVAPHAWPGSQFAVIAGYREVVRDA